MTLPSETLGISRQDFHLRQLRRAATRGAPPGPTSPPGVAQKWRVCICKKTLFIMVYHVYHGLWSLIFWFMICFLSWLLVIGYCGVSYGLWLFIMVSDGFWWPCVEQLASYSTIDLYMNIMYCTMIWVYIYIQIYTMVYCNTIDV